MFVTAFYRDTFRLDNPVLLFLGFASVLIVVDERPL